MKEISDELKKAFDLMKVNFMTVDEYENAIKKGDLKEKHLSVDDQEFSINNPKHPLASKNRFKRIKGADIINNITENFSEKELDNIHKFLFDCCATVRLSLVKAIMNERNQKSLNIVKELYEKEKNLALKNIKSNAVEQYSKMTIEILKNPHYEFLDLGFKNYIGELENNKANGMGILYYNGNGNIIYRGEFKNGQFHGSGTYYNDKGDKFEGEFKEGKFKSLKL